MLQCILSSRSASRSVSSHAGLSPMNFYREATLQIKASCCLTCFMSLKLGPRVPEKHDSVV
eukprot:2232787-Lingulodinium_polyedra.AAC.1